MKNKKSESAQKSLIDQAVIRKRECDVILWRPKQRHPVTVTIILHCLFRMQSQQNIAGAPRTHAVDDERW